jgi:hypothetical protein
MFEDKHILESHPDQRLSENECELLRALLVRAILSNQVSLERSLALPEENAPVPICASHLSGQAAMPHVSAQDKPCPACGGAGEMEDGMVCSQCGGLAIDVDSGDQSLFGTAEWHPDRLAEVCIPLSWAEIEPVVLEAERLLMGGAGNLKAGVASFIRAYRLTVKDMELDDIAPLVDELEGYIDE